MAANKTVVRNDLSRLWLLENRAGPNVVRRYISDGKAGTVAWNQGNATPVYRPSGAQPGVFDQISKQPGTPDAPQLPVTIREELTDLDVLLRLINNGNCDHDWQVAIGACKNPQDFNRGWQKKKILEAATISNYGSSGDIGALQPGDRNLMEETGTLNGVSFYEVKQLIYSELLGATVTRPMVDVVVADAVGCGGDCGTASDGCQKVFWVSSATAGSAGLGPVVIASEDGGATAVSRTITTLTAGENPNAGALVGDNFVIVSEDSESLHYAAVADVLDSSETWTEVTTGFVATKGPQDIFAPGPNDVFIAAEGGYIYYSSDPTDGVEVQTDGSITTENLTRIHGIDNSHVVAVGENNTVLVTHDGGDTWSARTGPNVGVNLTAVAMVSKDIYWVGAADGTLWYTTNDGASWHEKGFPGSGSGTVQDVVFATRTVGYMSHTTAVPAGRIFRTTDGGNSWYLMPEDTGASAIPANDAVYALAACNPNTVFGAGLADNATDGFAVKAS